MKQSLKFKTRISCCRKLILIIDFLFERVNRCPNICSCHQFNANTFPRNVKRLSRVSVLLDVTRLQSHGRKLAFAANALHKKILENHFPTSIVFLAAR